MSLTLVTAATIDPVDLAEVKTHVRIAADDHDDDVYLKGLISAATRQAEIELGDRQLIQATWDWKLDRFPKFFRVPKPPLSSVTSITYLDINGASQTLATSEYRVDTNSDPGRIIEEPNEQWPSVEADAVNVVTVRFVAGYGADKEDVPWPIRLAILQLIDLWYCQRAPVVSGSTSEVPWHIRRLLAGHGTGVMV